MPLSRAVSDARIQPNVDDLSNKTGSEQYPASGALVNKPITTTKAGLPRQRMKWTTDLNKSVMRCYFIATNLESYMTLYRAKMYNTFVNENPHLQITEQRLADQRRTIIHRKLLSDVIINELKEQVSEQLEAQNSTVDVVMGRCNNEEQQHASINTELQTIIAEHTCEENRRAIQEPRESENDQTSENVELEGKL